MVTPLDFMCILPKFTAYFRCSNGRFFPSFGPRQLSELNAAYLETICAQIFHSSSLSSRCCELWKIHLKCWWLWALFFFTAKFCGKFTDQFWQIGVKFAFSHSLCRWKVYGSSSWGQYWGQRRVVMHQRRPVNLGCTLRWSFPKSNHS